VSSVFHCLTAKAMPTRRVDEDSIIYWYSLDLWWKGLFSGFDRNPCRYVDTGRGIDRLGMQSQDRLLHELGMVSEKAETRATLHGQVARFDRTFLMGVF
jgi:hypothetical protein